MKGFSLVMQSTWTHGDEEFTDDNVEYFPTAIVVTPTWFPATREDGLTLIAGIANTTAIVSCFPNTMLLDSEIVEFPDLAISPIDAQSKSKINCAELRSDSGNARFPSHLGQLCDIHQPMDRGMTERVHERSAGQEVVS